ADPNNVLGGTLTMGAVNEASGAGSAAWTYSVSDNAADYLAAGQSVTENFTVTVNDNHGGSASQLVILTINGTNEAPIITASTTAAGSVTEDVGVIGGNLSATGNIAFSDVDLQ